MKTERHDLELLMRSRIPLIVVETHEENRVLDVVRALKPGAQQPLFTWSITDGLMRLEWALVEEAAQTEPVDVLKFIKASTKPAVFVLRDFHPYLSDPVNVRLLKDIAVGHEQRPHTIVLLSHAIELPPELRKYAAQLSLSLPDRAKIETTVDGVVQDWRKQGVDIRVDPQARELLISNLAGVSLRDVRRLARAAVVDDAALTLTDIPAVQQAKHALLADESPLYFEFDTAQFREVGGFATLKQWLARRHRAFSEPLQASDRPKGLLLLGVQGCGKSLAAKAVAGTWGVPLLRLDFGSLYAKYYGETERNLRAALSTAEVLAPCVLWIDEIEKALAAGGAEDGLPKRVLGTLLTWMAEQDASVFVVATANDIQALPPELVRKGRFDEIFFVDLPDVETRQEIFRIHCESRGIRSDRLDYSSLAGASEGFSGAEIEQAVIASRYATNGEAVTTAILLKELQTTRPLAVVMQEKIAALRSWAVDRTVPVS